MRFLVFVLVLMAVVGVTSADPVPPPERPAETAAPH